MKLTFMAIILIAWFFAGCARKEKSPHWDMTWSCNGNKYCASDMQAWNGSGSFSNETDCLAWETGFINTYVNVRVTSCTEGQ